MSDVTVSIPVKVTATDDGPPLLQHVESANGAEDESLTEVVVDGNLDPYSEYLQCINYNKHNIH